MIILDVGDLRTLDSGDHREPGDKYQLEHFVETAHALHHPGLLPRHEVDDRVARDEATTVGGDARPAMHMSGLIPSNRQGD